MQLTLEIDDQVAAELAYLVELHRQHGAPNPQQSVEDLAVYLLAATADGSRRPGSWERQCLTMMGLISSCSAHQVYRQHYGAPAVV